jgi:hypothetical protein
MFRRSAEEMRVVILAPIGRDAALLAQTLNESDIAVAIATDATALLALMMEGAVAEEGTPRRMPPYGVRFENKSMRCLAARGGNRVDLKLHAGANTGT